MRESPNFVFGLALLLFAACTDAPPPSVANLLQRDPEVLFCDRGVLIPDQERQWGELGASGWKPETERTHSGHPFVKTFLERASLSLPAGAPRDREIELILWRPVRNRATGNVGVYLNGLELGQQELGIAPAMVRVRAPKETWIWGANQLELRWLGGPARSFTPMALAQVDYGPAQHASFDRASATARLGAGTGLRYVIEPLSRVQLVVEGTSSGPGTLDVLFFRTDPRDGSSLALPKVKSVTFLKADTRRRVYSLPSVGEQLLQVAVHWTSAQAAELSLTKLELAGPAENRPPIVFISIDTLAARHLSLYGYHRPTTPNLEAFAKDAVVFNHCSANAPWTLPSYLSVLSGLYPRAHLIEVVAPNSSVWDRWQLAENRWTMAEMLRAMDYETAAFVDTQWLSPPYRVHQGFDVFDEQAGKIFVAEEGQADGISLVLDLSRQWLDSLDGERPFFLFLQAIDVHAPYSPPEPWQGSFMPDDSQAPTMVPAGCTDFSYGAIIEQAVSDILPEGRDFADVDVEQLIAAYDEEILALDAAIGGFLEELEARGLYDDTLIIFTADHGESFDHGFYGHSGTHYESILKVPLLIKLPGNRHAGVRVEGTVQLTDLYPTIYDLLSRKAQRTNLHGRSLLPLMDGRRVEPVSIYAEGGLVEQYSLEHGGWKLIEVFPGRQSAPDSVLTHPRLPKEWVAANFPVLLEQPMTNELSDELETRPDFEEKLAEARELVAGPFYELYDLRNDPDELDDQSAAQPERVAALLTRLEAERDRSRAARKEARVADIKIQRSAEVIEGLRKLGYSGD